MLPTLTKADLIKHLCEVLGINGRESREIVELFFNEITEGLIQEGTVKLPGFGVFITKNKRKRIGRNPRTGEPKVISRRRVVVFRVASKLKARVASYGAASKA